MYQQKYYWKDLDGRCFETANKRKILVPYDLVAHPIRLFGFEPVMVDPEPQVPVVLDHTGARCAVVSLVRKGTDPTLSPIEYGTTGTVNGVRITYLPVDVVRDSRAMIARSVTNSDMIVADEESALLIEELGADTSRIVDSEDLLVERLLGLVTEPSSPPLPTPADTYRNETKRTDILVDAHKKPSCWGIILDVQKTMQEGTTALVLIKSGTVAIGQHFVAGSGFGRVTNIWSPSGEQLMHALYGRLCTR
jgi:hypothetical protein